MAKKRFNWKLMLVLIIAVTAFGITAYALRKYRQKRLAYNGLEKGNEAYAQSNWRQAARNLGKYLTVVPNDTNVLVKYAEAQLKMRPFKKSNIQQAITAYRNILRLQKDNCSAAKRLIDLYLQMKMLILQWL